MTRAELERELAAAETEERAGAHRLLTKLGPLLGQSWVDATLRARARKLAERHELPLPHLAFQPLSIGESWLLLASSTGHGRALRMQVAQRGAAETALINGRTTGEAIAGLAAAATHQHRWVPREELQRRFMLNDSGSPAHVEGGSLGLACCVALASHVLGRAARTNVAGTAQVEEATGKLRPIRHLEAKLDALQAQWPEVDAVVVATEQPAPMGRPGLTVLRAATVAEALEHFGLSITELPQPPIEELESIVSSFAKDDTREHALTGWAARSRFAVEVAALLEADRAELAAQARVWAALFASHAGDNPRAEKLIRETPEASFDEPMPRTMRAIVLASACIDRDPNEAVELARHAVEQASTLVGSARRSWLGKALGTHGRALMHAGRYAEAEPLLRQARDHHEQHLKEDGPRSACYLATCLRLSGQAGEALLLAERTWTAASSPAERSLAVRATRSYAALEKGRALVALRRYEDARPVLLEVVGAQDSPRAYPRLGAHRTLAAALRGLGRTAEAEDHARVCWDLACDAQAPRTPRKLGLVAAVEHLVETPDGRPGLVSPDQVERLWAELFASETREHVLATWVY